MTEECFVRIMAVGSDKGIDAVKRILNGSYTDDDDNIITVYGLRVTDTTELSTDEYGYTPFLIKGEMSNGIDADKPVINEYDGQGHWQVGLPYISKLTDVSFEVFCDYSGLEMHRHICIHKGRVYLDHKVPKISRTVSLKGYDDPKTSERIYRDITEGIAEMFSVYILDDYLYGDMLDKVHDTLEACHAQGAEELTYEFGGLAWNPSRTWNIANGNVWDSKPRLYFRDAEEWC